jgi:hypothetical protein
MATTRKVAKQVHFIARYAHKTDKKLNGIVSYAVRSSNSKDIYCTTLINGKASGCSCPSHKPCYHMVQLEAREASRQVVETVAVSVDEMAVQVATPVAVEEYRMSNAVYAKLKATAKPAYRLLADLAEMQERREQEITGKQRASSERMMKATLNQNRAFSILR